MGRGTEDECSAALNAFTQYGTKAEAARRLGISVSTLKSRIEKAQRTPGSSEAPPADPIELPIFPNEDIPIEEVLDYLGNKFAKRSASIEAHTWFPVKVKEGGPIGLIFVGDPHIDDNGCDIPTLRRHAALCRDTAGMYAINIGDSSNAWGGRLIKKYADQDTSLSTARRLVEWLLIDSGFRWLVWLYGNHEHMGDGADIIAQMIKRYGTHKLVCHDWEARFSIRFPNGWEPRVFAAHNFSGTSIWNPLHGPMREGQTGADANLYVCGHLHNWGVFKFENAARNLTQAFIRTRGYKFHDDFARRHGKFEQRSGCSIVAILDPERQSVQVFEDVEIGSEYLTWLRERSA